MARCDQEINCGLYSRLVEIGAIREGAPCAKPTPKECVRYQFANGKNVAQAQQMFRTSDVLGSRTALTRGETELMFPQGVETYFEGGDF